MKWLWEQFWKVFVWLWEQVKHFGPSLIFAGAILGTAHMLTKRPPEPKPVVYVTVPTPQLELKHDEGGCRVVVKK